MKDCLPLTALLPSTSSQSFSRPGITLLTLARCFRCHCRPRWVIVRVLTSAICRQHANSIANQYAAELISNPMAKAATSDQALDRLMQTDDTARSCRTGHSAPCWTVPYCSKPSRVGRQILRHGSLVTYSDMMMSVRKTTNHLPAPTHWDPLRADFLRYTRDVIVAY